MRLIQIAICTLSGLLASNTGFTADPARTAIRIDSLIRLARVSILNETREFNETLRTPESARGKMKKRIRTFVRAGIHEISDEYTLSKCIFDEGDFANLISPVLTLKDDETYGKITSLLTTRDLYGRRFYEGISEICRRARASFTTRLERAELRDSVTGLDAGKGLSPLDQDLIVKAIFVPTDSGKKGLLQRLQDRDLGFAALTVVSTAGASLGLLLPGLILTGICAADETKSLVNSIGSTNPNLYLMKLPELTLDSPGFEVALTEEESNLLRATRIPER